MIKCQFEDDDSPGAALRHVAVTVIVEHNGKILLPKRADHLMADPGKYGPAGGFLNRDENMKEGVARETLEETGYLIKAEELLVISDNPNRKGDLDQQTVDFVFIGKLINDDPVQEPDNEVSEVRWFFLDALPPEDEVSFDHYDNLQIYLKYKKEKFDLPVFRSEA